MRVTSVNLQALHIDTAFADHAVMKESRGPTSTNIFEPIPVDSALSTKQTKDKILKREYMIFDSIFYEEFCLQA